MRTLFVERLTVLDFSYLHPDRGLLGESWWLDAELTGDLDDQGMILDFGEVKKQLKQHADRHYDHKLMVPARYSGCHIKSTLEVSHLSFETRRGNLIKHQSPSDALCLIDAEAVTVDTVAKEFVSTLLPQLPNNVNSLDIKLKPESTKDAFFHYSHGLKHHAGNCQRIAHGHRSRIVILKDGRRDPALESTWSDHWKDIYIGSREDLIDQPEQHGIKYHKYAYSGDQGRFELQLPAENCYIIDTDSTIENLAQHVAEMLANEHPGHEFEVRAFEGIGKGALGRASGK